MEDFAGLVVFFVIIGLIEKFGKKSKKNRNTPNEPGKQPAERAAARKAARSAREAALSARAMRKPASTEGVGMPEIQRAIEAAKQAKARAVEPKAKEKTAIEQAAGPRQIGLADIEGCIGGSIAHTQHEGEGKAEHARHMQRTAQTAPTTVAPTVSRLELRGASLRKAVIMSEILDKPKALRH